MHCQTNQNLAAPQAHGLESDYGGEYEVTCQTHPGKKGGVGRANFWAIEATRL